MRVKCILGICLALIITVTGCKEEPKTVTKEPTAVTKGANPVKADSKAPVKVSVRATAEQGKEEKEYFAVFMEGKKVGYAIQRTSA